MHASCGMALVIPIAEWDEGVTIPVKLTGFFRLHTLRL